MDAGVADRNVFAVSIRDIPDEAGRGGGVDVGPVPDLAVVRDMNGGEIGRSDMSEREEAAAGEEDSFDDEARGMDGRGESVFVPAASVVGDYPVRIVGVASDGNRFTPAFRCLFPRSSPETASPSPSEATPTIRTG